MLSQNFSFSTQNFLKLSSKPLEGFLKSFRRFRENLWHLSDDSTKIVPREGADAACVTLRNDRER